MWAVPEIYKRELVHLAGTGQGGAGEGPEEGQIAEWFIEGRPRDGQEEERKYEIITASSTF